MLLVGSGTVSNEKRSRQFFQPALNSFSFFASNRCQRADEAKFLTLIQAQQQ